MENYQPAAIEKKWQQRWEEEKLSQAKDFAKKPKYYLLIEFPYPSGERLHVGHGRSYCAFDALARLKRMQGYNVLFPFGWDAFGLPAENYAVKTGIHPRVTTKENIDNARQQARSWGLSFDWSREIDTTDPAYYRWTQWIFLQLFKKGLAYKAEIAVNWCPSCKTNLANEEVVQGACERCGASTERRMQKQWMLKITAYADRLLADLEKVDYREDIKRQQVNWIGRSEGVAIKFPLPTLSTAIEAFTTRADTLFGTTFLVLAPEHPLVGKLTTSKQKKAVEAYVKEALRKSELQRQEEMGEKTGVFTGSFAKHPFTGEEIPIWVSDFVLLSYGSGAVMGVPAHDQRDFKFAKKFALPIKEVVVNKRESSFPKEAFTGEGELISSGDFDGLQSGEAIDKIAAQLEKKGLGKKTIDYKLRDWVFSRQHYWGEPIPIVICKKCGYVPVPEEELPVELPYVEQFKPTETGESPLASITDWVTAKCPACGGSARRETDTMPNWAGSSWYFLRYTDPQNSEEFADPKKLAYWTPVDWYNGGFEHTTLHLLYSRFWHKFLFDEGLVPSPEPYQKRTSHGVVLGPDGGKMSKSRGNVVNPDEVVRDFGADTFRVYEMFMGPFEQRIAWDPQGVQGVHRFLERVWKAHSLILKQTLKESDKELEGELHRLLKKVGEDLPELKFNTAVAALMSFLNELSSRSHALSAADWALFLRVLAPFAPHLAEELWEGLPSKVRSSRGSGEDSIHQQSWPSFDKELVSREKVTIVVQVNGKLRGRLSARPGEEEKKLVASASSLETVRPHLEGEKISKTIFLPDRLINFVVKK
jgi:leucyl-tRNA synthetase